MVNLLADTVLWNSVGFLHVLHESLQQVLELHCCTWWVVTNLNSKLHTPVIWLVTLMGKRWWVFWGWGSFVIVAFSSRLLLQLHVRRFLTFVPMYQRSCPHGNYFCCMLCLLPKTQRFFCLLSCASSQIQGFERPEAIIFEARFRSEYISKHQFHVLVIMTVVLG